MIRLALRGVRNLVRHPLRLVLVLMLLGTSLLFVEASAGLNGSAQARLAELGRQVGSSIQITHQGGPLSQQQINLIVHTPGVISYAEQAQTACSSTDSHFKLIPFTQTSSAASGGATTICYGFTPGAPAALRVKSSAPGGITITEGRMFTPTENQEAADVAIIGASLAQFNHISPGASIGLDGKTFTVIGVYSTGSTLDAWILFPVHTLLSAFPATTVSSLTVYTSGVTTVSQVLVTLQHELGNSSVSNERRPSSPGTTQRERAPGMQESGFQFATTQSQFASSLQSLETIEHISQLGFALALATAVLVMVFTACWLVRERRKEIGVLRAVGASHWQVVGQCSTEMLGLSLLAACLSVALVLPFGSTIASAAVVLPPTNQGAVVNNAATAQAIAQPLAIQLSAQSILVLLLIALFLALIASSVPAWYVARLRPAHALRIK